MLMLGGFLLVTTSAALAFLMAARLIEASFPLAFLAYAASLSGLVLGLRVLVIRASGRHGGRLSISSLRRMTAHHRLRREGIRNG